MEPSVTSDTDAGSAPTERVARPVNARTYGVVGLLVLGLLYTLYFARSFLLPIAIAVLLNLLLSPVVRGLKRLHIPPALGAALIILSLLGLH